eukprot:15085251-Alexandrium_andersonii.AAC.1
MAPRARPTWPAHGTTRSPSTEPPRALAGLWIAWGVPSWLAHSIAEQLSLIHISEPTRLALI